MAEPDATNNRSLANERQRFSDLSHRALTEINSALGHDERNMRNEALVSYKKGVRLIEEALSITLIGSELSAELGAKREKMITTLSHAKSRIDDLSPVQRGTRLPLSRQTGLPTYEEAVSPEEPCPGSTAMCNAEVILEISTAQIFYITPDGFVSSPSYPSPLRICKFLTHSVAGAPEHFLQIGTFTLPLVQELTPSLHTHNGAYILPDVTSTQQGAAIGILLDDRTPAEHVSLFESLIAELTALKASELSTNETEQTHNNSVTPSCTTRQPPARPSQPPATVTQSPGGSVEMLSESSSNRLSAKIGKGLTTAAEWMSWGVEKGAEGVGGLVSYGSAKLRANIQPPSQDKTVEESYRRGVVKARYVTHQAVAVSSFVVKALGDMTVKLGRAAAPYVKSQAKSFLPEKITQGATAKDASGRSKMDDLAEVAGAGIRGFGVVYLSLEEAGKALGRVLAVQTSAIMSQKYGQQYGVVTEHAMYTVGNTLISAHNVSNLGPKAIAKRAVKDTAKQVVTNDGSATTHGPEATLEITDVTDEYKDRS